MTLQEDIEKEAKNLKAQEELLDCQIVQRVLQLFQFTNQVKSNRTVLHELESGLLSFALCFKNYVLNESRMINIGYSMIPNLEQMDPEDSDLL